MKFRGLLGVFHLDYFLKVLFCLFVCFTAEPYGVGHCFAEMFIRVKIMFVLWGFHSKNMKGSSLQAEILLLILHLSFVCGQLLLAGPLICPSLYAVEM